MLETTLNFRDTYSGKKCRQSHKLFEIYVNLKHNINGDSELLNNQRKEIFQIKIIKSDIVYIEFPFFKRFVLMFGICWFSNVIFQYIIFGLWLRIAVCAYTRI